MLKNEKIKFFLYAFIILIIIGFLIWQGIIKINSDINNSISALKDKKISRDVYSLKGKALGQEREAYSFSKSKIEKINNFFVYASDNDDTEFTSFFGQLDAIAMQSTQKEKSLDIDLYQDASVPDKSKTKSASAKVPSSAAAEKEDSRLFKLTLRSGFEGLLKFISYIEVMPYYVYIESINININSASAALKKSDKNNPNNDSIDLQSVIIIKVFRKTNIL